MAPDLLDACRAIFRVIRIESNDAVRVGDVVCSGVGANLVHWLQCQIYMTFFCSMDPVPSPVPTAHFIAGLTAANCGGKSSRTESLTSQPGSYFAFGPKEPDGTKWLRFYWNVSPGGAIALTRYATSTLNRQEVPFRLKVQLETAIRRRDAAVLYLPVELWPAARTVIDGVYGQLGGSDDLRPDTPLFTKVLRPGVSLAEDPQTGLSFGMHRSWLVARSLVKSRIHGPREETAQLLDLEREFAAEGLSLERPYLNAGSTDVYDL